MEEYTKPEKLNPSIETILYRLMVLTYQCDPTNAEAQLMKWKEFLTEILADEDHIVDSWSRHPDLRHPFILALGGGALCRKCGTLTGPSHDEAECAIVKK